MHREPESATGKFDMSLKLILGNKNYSSWSLRPWIAMRNAGIPFEEEVIPLYEPGSAERMAAYSPTGKVPVLLGWRHGDLGVARDPRSYRGALSTARLLAKLIPKRGRMLAPSPPKCMLASVPLRRDCPMNMRRESKKTGIDR